MSIFYLLLYRLLIDTDIHCLTFNLKAYDAVFTKTVIKQTLLLI